MTIAVVTRYCVDTGDVSVVAAGSTHLVIEKALTEIFESEPRLKAEIGENVTVRDFPIDCNDGIVTYDIHTEIEVLGV